MTMKLDQAMTGQEMVALSKQHSLYEWSAQAHVDPIPVAKAKGIYFWTPEGKRFIDFNSQLMCVNIGHGDPRVIKAIQDQAATLAYANPFMATEARAGSGRSSRRFPPATSTSSSSPTAAPRPTRTRSASRGWPPAATRSSRAIARITAAPAPASPPPAIRAAGRWSRACPASSTCRIRITGRSAAPTVRRRRARRARRDHHARGAADHRRLPHRNGHRHQRHSRAARRLSRRRARALRQARHPADLRRGDVGLRPHRRVVRRRSLEGRARHPDDGEGPDERVCGARRRRHPPQDRRSLQGQGVLRRPHLQQPSARLRRGAGDDRRLRRGQPDRARQEDGRGDEADARGAEGEASLRSATSARSACSASSSS